MDLRRGLRIACLVGSSTVGLAGCMALGRGHGTVVLATPAEPPSYEGSEFSDLIASPEGPRVLPGQGTAASEAVRWADYRSAHAGTLESARLDLSVRDLNVTPALDPLNIESTNAGDIAKIMADNTTTPAQKAALVRQLRDNYRRMPENYMPLVSRQERAVLDAGRGLESVTVYHYFPKVSLDLTGELQTVASLDRFDFLAVAVRLVDPTAGVRFANFSPKAADLFDFSIGTLKQTESATGSASPGSSATSKSTSSNTPAPGSTAGSERDTGATFGSTVSLTLSDELTRDLKSSLDSRSAGIVDDGRVFIVELRSNDQHRVAGTYSYSVMLDVPSQPKRVQAGGEFRIVSNPVTDHLDAEVRIIGVVRHVAKMGSTGTFKRVPEPTNDDTFDEVLVREKRITLWTLHQDVMIDPEARPDKPTNLVVYTNQDASTFTVYSDGPGHPFLARGKGRESSFSLEGADRVSIVFDPIITTANAPAALKAPSLEHVPIDPSGKVKAQVVSNYLPPTARSQATHGQ